MDCPVKYTNSIWDFSNEEKLCLPVMLGWLCTRGGGVFVGCLVWCHDFRLTLEGGGSKGDMFQPSVGEGGRF